MSPTLPPVSRRNLLRGAAVLAAGTTGAVTLGARGAEAATGYAGVPTVGQMSISSSPDLSAVRSMSAVVLLPHEYGRIPYIKSVNPRAKVFAYKNIAAVSRYGSGPWQPSVVTYQQVQANWAWQLRDVNGSTIYWTDFGGYLQPIDTGHQGVINASVQAIISECRQNGWDGIYLDDLITEWNHTNTGASYPVNFTGGSVYASLRNWVVNAVPQLRAAGIEVVGNAQVGPDSVWPDALATWSTYMNGVALEHWSRWGDYSSSQWPNFTGYLFDQRRKQAQLIQSKGAYLMAISFGDSWDVVGQRFFRALFLLLSDGGGYSFWTPSNYNGSYYQPTAMTDLGAPTSAATQLSNGLWKRTFERGFVVVNGTSSAQGGSAASAGLGASTQWVTINSGDALIQTW